MTFLERQLVQSSNLRSVSYDAAKKNLEIEFRSGIIHQYQNVPSRIHTGLMTASSAGIYYADNIKNRFRTVSIGRQLTR
ncbi:MULTISPECIES: KTSC domain-containing protein [unclassified Methanoregula]|uniref:KTSC domain-containing protein n=1 Tax=unclassified Methanoregula TaxID=2649730 RepID=UPI0025CC5E99|nr:MULTISPECIES: KTSC domain-containing protein [unclassified Methanoregula]